MTTTTTTGPRTLDDLAKLGPDALLELYKGARTPKVEDLTGDLKGRMLAVLKTSKIGAAILRRIARSSGFPWRGKSFQAAPGAERGEGKNRVVMDRLKLFKFETSVGKSRAGDFDAVQLDYDNPGNPFFIRPIKDEVREVAPNLWLGQAWLQVRGTPHLVLYFGLEKS